MRKIAFGLVIFFCAILVCFQVLRATNGYNKTSIPMSKETEACIECHRVYSPGIVADWQKSRHAMTIPKDAISKPMLQKRISSETIPKSLAEVAVGCYECHSLNGTAHKDNFEHFDLKINVIVSPNDCKVCHVKEVKEYENSKKAHALSNLDKNGAFSLLVHSVAGLKTTQRGKVKAFAPSENTKNETCYACHGTEVKIIGTKKIASDLGNIEVPGLTNLPNHGVGRINPDGSRGACSACHVRHNFSIEVARKPYTCSQCHLEPDTPAYNVYMESKHGNIFSSQYGQWKFDAVPWVVGKDFNAPTCAACHNCLIVNEKGDVIQNRNHDFGSRLWVRIFGLIYSHPQPKDGRTYLIKNREGFPLPTTFSGELSADYLIDEREQERRLASMGKNCRSCHSRSWTEGHFNKFALTIKEVDKMVASSTNIIADAWKKGWRTRRIPLTRRSNIFGSRSGCFMETPSGMVLP